MNQKPEVFTHKILQWNVVGDQESMILESLLGCKIAQQRLLLNLYRVDVGRFMELTVK